MELLVRAGLTPKAALLAGTSNSALALGLSGDRGTIEKGKRADLILIDGKPWDTIADVEKIDSVFVDGTLVHGAGAKPPAGNSATALPALPAAALIDDFERADGRSALDTLRLTDMDGGVERSSVVLNRVTHAAGNGAALAFAVRMSLKDKPEGGVLIPLSRGSVRPVDARKFAGVRLEMRGAGAYSLVVNTLAGEFTAPIEAREGWSEVRVPFAALVPTRPGRGSPPSWRGDDLVQVGVIVEREAGSSAWGEIDNLGFY
mgnify:FL=1